MQLCIICDAILLHPTTFHAAFVVQLSYSVYLKKQFTKLINELELKKKNSKNIPTVERFTLVSKSWQIFGCIQF